MAFRKFQWKVLNREPSNPLIDTIHADISKFPFVPRNNETASTASAVIVGSGVGSPISRMPFRRNHLQHGIPDPAGSRRVSREPRGSAGKYAGPHGLDAVKSKLPEDAMDNSEGAFAGGIRKPRLRLSARSDSLRDRLQLLLNGRLSE